MGIWLAEQNTETNAAGKAEQPAAAGKDAAPKVALPATYFRIGANGSYQRLKIDQNGLQMDYGRMKSQKITDRLEEYEVTLKRETPVKASIKVIKRGTDQQFVYNEAKQTITARREQASTADLVARYEVRVQAAAGLLQP